MALRYFDSKLMLLLPWTREPRVQALNQKQGDLLEAFDKLFNKPRLCRDERVLVTVHPAQRAYRPDARACSI